MLNARLDDPFQAPFHSPLRATARGGDCTSFVIVPNRCLDALICTLSGNVIDLVLRGGLVGEIHFEFFDTARKSVMIRLAL